MAYMGMLERLAEGEAVVPALWLLEVGNAFYDATCLDLAMGLGVPLATLDNALRQAATRCQVEVL